MIESMGREPEYNEGPQARKSFEETMRKLFRAAKPEIKPKPSKRVSPKKEK